MKPITIRLPSELIRWLQRQKRLTGIPIQKNIELALRQLRDTYEKRLA